ncbi:MAG: penicillin-binding protein 1A [Firmicutes bacterium]|nr:penicillin-binding protein 1A [Bacillota bacterium]
MGDRENDRENRDSRVNRRRQRSKRKVRGGRVFSLIFIVTVFIVAGITLGYLAIAIKDMPTWDPDKLEASETTIVYDYKGQPAASLHGTENRQAVKLNQIPKSLQYAFIATEDEYFYEHHGVRPVAIARAGLMRIFKGASAGGASTITQQLVKNTFFMSADKGPANTLERKIQEAILALRLERQYTKDEILEMYLNRIYLGEGTNGVQAASQFYFNKKVSDLNLQESALLAGMASSPGSYSPIRKPEVALERRNFVLSRMENCGYLTAAQVQQASKEPIVLGKNTTQASSGTATSNKNQYFIDHVIDETEEILTKLGTYDNPGMAVYQDGLRIYTTLDQELQGYAETIYSQDKYFPPSKNDMLVQSAAVILNPHTGEVKTIIGGRNYTQKRGFNRATDSLRQPGSAFKPIAVYAPALAKGFYPGYVLDDSPVAFKAGGTMWSPKNYDDRYRGPITMRAAVKDSVNVYAVKLLDQIGISEGVRFAESMGITSLVKTGAKNDYTMSLALGGLTHGVSPLELTAAFGTFANQGVYVKPYVIEKITDRNDRVIYQHRSQQQVVMDPQTAYLMTSMLQTVMTSGTGTTANIGRPAGGKTGTTDDDTNAWFVGITPDLAGAVWMGFDNQNVSLRASGRTVYGSTLPGPIWKALMTKAHEKIPVHDFSQPGGLTTATVCRMSGKLAGPNCPQEDLSTDLFTSGSVPSENCDLHVMAEVCPESGKLATPYCPNRITRAFIKRSDEEATRNPVPEDLPRDYCDLHGFGVTPGEVNPKDPFTPGTITNPTTPGPNPDPSPGKPTTTTSGSSQDKTPGSGNKPNNRNQKP